MEYAGFWMRTLATIVDAVLYVVVQFVVFKLFGASMFPDVSSATNAQEMQQIIDAHNAATFVPQLICGIGYLVYKIGMEASSFQGTIGKVVLGLRVTDINGDRISIGRSIGRWAAGILSAIIIGIGYLMVAFTGKKQGLHDMIAGTLVLRK